MNFEFVKGPVHSRYWFLTDDSAELLQFQPDRFTQNWRKVASVGRPYPRFEAMIERFFADFDKLAGLANSKGWGVITPNQCEVSYINHLPASDESGQAIPVENYISSLRTTGLRLEDVRCALRKEIKNDSGEAIGRYVVEIASAWDADGASIYRLAIVARGAPPDLRSDGCRAFMESARVGIAEIFLEITTKEAQEQWGRVA